MVLQLLKHFTTVEKITIRLTALSSFRTTGPWKEFSGLQGRTGGGGSAPFLGKGKKNNFHLFELEGQRAWL